MTHTKKINIYILLCGLFINDALYSHPFLGEFYKSTSGHNLLILVDNNTPSTGSEDLDKERQFKRNAIYSIEKLLSNTEINLILENRPEETSTNIKEFIDTCSKNFDADPKWNEIVEQNYSNPNSSNLTYKAMNLDPKSATKLYILVSNMKKHLDDLPLKDHLNFILKHSTHNNNFFKSCRFAKDYFKLDRVVNKSKSDLPKVNTLATVTFADWRSDNIMNITTKYRNGLKVLSQNAYLSDKQSWSNFAEDIARAFVPQNKENLEFTPLDTLRTKDLLDDLEAIIKKLNQLENSTSIEAEQELWLKFKIEMQIAKDYILNSISIFKNLSQEDKDAFEKLFKTMPKYQYAKLHWFAIIYAYLLKDKNPANAIYPENNEWVKILTEDLLYAGIMDAILASKIKDTNTVLYINQDTYKIISENLAHLEYNKAIEFNNSTNDPIDIDQLQILVNQFPVSIARLKQVLKPITCSLKF